MTDLDALKTASFWLLPVNAAEIQNAADALSKEFGTPRFQVHMTIHCTFDSVSVKDLRKALQDAAKERKSPIRLQVSGVGHSPVEWKTLFLEFPASADLVAIHERFKTSLPSSYVFIPHVSLMYQADTPVDVREKLATRFESKFKGLVIEFHSIVLVSPGKGMEDFGDVSLWEILDEA